MRDNCVPFVPADKEKPNIAAISRPHAVRNEPRVTAVIVGTEPEERDVAVDVDPERPALAVIEDESAVIPATHRPQTGQQFVVALHATYAVKVVHLHAASTSSFVDEDGQLHLVLQAANSGRRYELLHSRVLQVSDAAHVAKSEASREAGKPGG